MSTKISPAMEIRAFRVPGRRVPQLLGRAREVLAARHLVALLFLHPLAQELADEARDARVPLGRPDAGPPGDVLVEGDGDVPKAHGTSVTRGSCGDGARAGSPKARLLLAGERAEGVHDLRHLIGTDPRLGHALHP